MVIPLLFPNFELAGSVWFTGFIRLKMTPECLFGAIFTLKGGGNVVSTGWFYIR